MPKFKAPKHVNAITISDGTVYHAADKAEDGSLVPNADKNDKEARGFIDVPADAPAYHFAQLAASGFEKIDDKAAPAKAAVAQPAPATGDAKPA